MNGVVDGDRHAADRDEIAFDRTGPGTPAGRYLRQFWTPVAEASEVAAGRAKTIGVMSENFTLYRGEDGTPHLLPHRCPHRNTILGTGRVDGDTLQCFYHGWRFNGEGQCVAQPAEEHPFAHKVAIRSYPVREYLGFVFAFLGEGEPPAFPTINVFSEPGFRASSTYVRKTNYFNSLENSCDWIHVFFTHARSGYTANGVNREIPKVWAEETEYGLAAYQRYTDGKEGTTYILMPLAMYILGRGPKRASDGQLMQQHQLAWRVPIDDYTHRSFNAYYVELFGADADRYHEERTLGKALLAGKPSTAEVVAAILRGELHADEVEEDRSDLVPIQDTITMEPQPPISERPYDRLGPSDGPCILLRRIYAREVRAHVSGQPNKTWAWPHSLQAVPKI